MVAISRTCDIARSTLCVYRLILNASCYFELSVDRHIEAVLILSVRFLHEAG